MHAPEGPPIRRALGLFLESHAPYVRRAPLCDRGAPGPPQALSGALGGWAAQAFQELQAQGSGRRAPFGADGGRSARRAVRRRQGPAPSELRALQGSITWYAHTRAYIDRKWSAAPTKSRKNYTDALATLTPALVKSTAGKPDAALLRRALYGWGTTETGGRRDHPRTSPALCNGWPRTRYRSPPSKTQRRSAWRWTLWG